MSTSHPDSRTQVAIDGGIYLLDRTQNYDDLKDRLQSAARTGGEFVDLRLEGDRRVSILVSAASRVVMATGPVDADGAGLHFQSPQHLDTELRFSEQDPDDYYG